VHAPLARAAGISERAIESIREGAETPPLSKPDERVVHAVAHQLTRERRIRPDTYAGAVALIGDVGMVDLVGVIGYYTLICMTIVGFEVASPGADPFL
jgi:4-carboxymuconolactone decarboxylase